MSNSLRLAMALLPVCFLSVPARAHYHMLLPEAASVKRGDAVAILYQWGHPFEHQLFDAPSPKSVIEIRPDGSKKDITQSLEKSSVPGADGKKVTAWRFGAKPEM